jgi:predicted nuclease of predicted toxin-antitoxin system
LILRILVDQNIPAVVCDVVRKRKPHWRVDHVNEVGLKGVADEIIFAWAQRNGAIILTFDEDFADARMYPVGSHSGVVRLRVWPTTIENTEAALVRLSDSIAEEDLPGSLVIVDQTKIRVRRSARHG